MNIVLKQGTRWQYAGPGDGKGQVHTVTLVLNSGNPKNPEIITWSDFSPDLSEGGMSWLGPYVDFIKQFKPVM